MSLKPNKVCPVVLRKEDDKLMILAFRHPFAGCQLVKGSIEKDESPADAALRELFEESGIDSAKIVGNLGVWDADFENQIWAFYLCEADESANQWTHHTQDDGGLDFSFFRQDIDGESDADWHPLYRRALKYIKQQLIENIK